MNDYLLRREGKWTKVSFEPDRVVVRYTSTYTRSAIAWVIAISGLALWFLIPPVFRNLDRGIAFAITGIVLLLIAKLSFDTVRRSQARVRKPYLVISDRHCALHTCDSELVVSANDIGFVEVRDNQNRQIEDPALWQTYVHFKSDRAPVLVHQRYKWNHDAEIALARSLAERWGVPLRTGSGVVFVANEL